MISALRTGLCAVFFLAVSGAHIDAQENSAKRLSSIVSVAIEEYGKAVDSKGNLISKDEYAETTEFLADAKGVAQRLRGYNAALTQAILDTLITAVEQKVAPVQVRLIHARFDGALGAELLGALKGYLEQPVTMLV